MFDLLKRNARSLVANGPEFKRFVAGVFKDQTEVLCIQVTCLDFVLSGY